jgi:membrane protein implicated in regulation of membrane protease activity
MDWSPATGWWVAAGVLVAVEMVTGTFYLLMLALGAAAAALAAHAGASTSLQWVVAAMAGGGATAAWHLKRARHPRSAPAASNRDVNLDIGSTVRVDTWSPDGTARVTFRGAAWSARHVGPGAPRTGAHVITSIEGNELGLTFSDRS